MIAEILISIIALGLLAVIWAVLADFYHARIPDWRTVVSDFVVVAIIALAYELLKRGLQTLT